MKEVLGEAVLEPLEQYGRLDKLEFVKRIEYDVESNWKVIFSCFQSFRRYLRII